MQAPPSRTQHSNSHLRNSQPRTNVHRLVNGHDRLQAERSNFGSPDSERQTADRDASSGAALATAQASASSRQTSGPKAHVAQRRRPDAPLKMAKDLTAGGLAGGQRSVPGQKRQTGDTRRVMIFGQTSMTTLILAKRPAAQNMFMNLFKGQQRSDFFAGCPQ